jgi:hypothetical protein
MMLKCVFKNQGEIEIQSYRKLEGSCLNLKLHYKKATTKQTGVRPLEGCGGGWTLKWFPWGREYPKLPPASLQPLEGPGGIYMNKIPWGVGTNP